jgi:serine/threonine protein kinase
MAHMYDKGDQPVPGYRLVQFLGRGGIGEVWKASGPGGTECAIKIIGLGDKQGLKEFRATRLVKRIRHPYLTPIIAFWLKDAKGNVLGDAGDAGSLMVSDQGAEMIVAMGLGEKNLADRLKECKAEGKPGVPIDELLNYMVETAKAIDFLNQPRHDLGNGPVAIQHCDIKPQNILIVGGSAQVCDFGLARQLNDARKTSMAAGTYAYIAPESIESKSSKTNDQYSLAISYIELRTGHLPFNSSSLYDVMFAHLQGKLDYSRLPENERPILKRATDRNPEARFGTTLEMVKALRRVIQGRSGDRSVSDSSGTMNVLPSSPAVIETKGHADPLRPTAPVAKPEFDPFITRTGPSPAPPSPAATNRPAPAPAATGHRQPLTPPPPPRRASAPHAVAAPAEGHAASPVPSWKRDAAGSRKKMGLFQRLKAWLFGS